MSDVEFLTVDQVCKSLLVGPDAIRRWLRDGQLKGYKLPGGDWRIKPEDVDTVLVSPVSKSALRGGA